MNDIFSLLWLLLGLACMGYYLLIGIKSRFRINMAWIWPAVGSALLIAGMVGFWADLPGWIRIAWRALMVAGIALVAGLESFVVRGMKAVTPKGLNYLIILGAQLEEQGPSEALRHRVDAAAKYLRENPKTIAIASGGLGVGAIRSEAECIRNMLVRQGIPENRILMEDKSVKTSENMEFSLKLMSSTEASVGLATNSYHVFRALGLAKKAGIKNVCGLAAKYADCTLLHHMMREGACTIADYFLGNL